MDGVMKPNEELRQNSKVAVHILLSFRHLCIVSASLPFGALVVCFVTAYIFQADEIHETHCRVSSRIKYIENISKRMKSV